MQRSEDDIVEAKRPRRDGLRSHRGWLDPELGGALRKAAGLRSLIAPGHAKIDLDRVRRIVERDLDDLLKFAAPIRERLPRS